MLIAMFSLLFFFRSPANSRSKSYLIKIIIYIFIVSSSFLHDFNFRHKYEIDRPIFDHLRKLRFATQMANKSCTDLKNKCFGLNKLTAISFFKVHFFALASVNNILTISLCIVGFPQIEMTIMSSQAPTM